MSLIRDDNGVIEFALFGSAASDKAVQKDFDLMVFIENTDCISQVSKSIRKTSHIFHAHDVFVFDKNRNYLGRICQRDPIAKAQRILLLRFVVMQKT